MSYRLALWDAGELASIPSFYVMDEAVANYLNAVGIRVNMRTMERTTKRAALLKQIQELTMERVMYAPLLDFRALIGVGPKIAAHAINLLPVHPFPPLEESRLK